ncbi:hypothetical protein WN944_018938 [Citrus x changshan-huyou]|uniref:Uncharacterized protein n=1 Tax=Citrus x changshan-huyou TaxID=2935761 RepID=A0AAP0LVP3_9ROSI
MICPSHAKLNHFLLLTFLTITFLYSKDGYNSVTKEGWTPIRASGEPHENCKFKKPMKHECVRILEIREVAGIEEADADAEYDNALKEAIRAVKRRRFLALSEEEEKEVVVKRKLVNDFDRVASDDLIGVIVRSKLSKGRDEIEELSVSLEKTTKKANNMKTNIRTFPRLAKCR